MYLLDTNVWVVHLRSKGLSKPSLRLQSAAIWQIKTCSIVRGELLTGAMKSMKSARAIVEIQSLLGPLQSFPFDDKSSEIYAKIRAELEAKGTIIGANDLMIAAIAMTNNLILVTHNIAEFSRVPGLQLEDWQ